MRILPALLCLLLTGASAFGSSAATLYKQGQKAEQAGQMARAYLFYAQAAALEPSNQFYWLKSQALRTRAALEAKSLPKPAPDAPAQPSAPAAEIPEATAQELKEARKPLPPKELSGNPGRRDFNLTGDSKSLFEQVAKAFGLDCVFDGEYQPSRPFRFRMEGADYREALHGLEAATGSFLIPLADRLFLVAKDTPPKRAELEPSVAVIVNLPEPTSAQDLTGLITAVQQTLGIQKVSWNTQRNMVVLRDSISKVLPARQLIEDLLYPRAQIVMDLDFLEVGRSQLVDFGFTLPNSLPIIPLTTKLGNKPQIPSGISALRVFGGGGTLLGLAVVDSMVVAKESRSNGRTLLHAELRSVDGQAATLHVGDRYPVLTGGYFGPASFSGPGAYTPPPSFTFEDLGLTVKATPKVHGMDAVSLDLETEFRLLTGEAINGIPVISNRQFKSMVRLETGQWAAIAGLMDSNQARTIAGIAGLSSLPFLSPLFSRHTNTNDSSEVLVLVRPRVVTLPPDQAVTHRFRLGSETRPITPL